MVLKVFNIVMSSYVYAGACCYCVELETGEEVPGTSRPIYKPPICYRLKGKKYL